MESRDHAETILYSILFLFFFQLIADFIESIYASGLLAIRPTADVAALAFLLSPILLLPLRKGPSGWPLVLLGEAMLVARVLEPLVGTRGRMLVSGLGVACFLLLLPALLGNARRRNEWDASVRGFGVAIALALSILFRVLGSGLDISTWRGYQAVGWLLAVAGGILLLRLPPAYAGVRDDGPPATPEPDGTPMGFGRTTALCVGFMSVLVLLYFAFMTPNVVARWTEASYPGITALLVVALFLFPLLWASPRAQAHLLSRRALWAWNGLFAAALATTILIHQVRLPDDPSAYPLYAGAPTLLHRVPLVLMLLSFPVLLVDLALYVRELGAVPPRPHVLAGSFALASLFLALMICAHIFTTVYDYIPAVGPYFRDRFWLVHLAVAIAAMAPLVLVLRTHYVIPATPRHAWVWPLLVGLLGGAAIIGAFATAAKPAPTLEDATRLRILTYNIQQGYSAHGQRNFDGQVGVLLQANADIIGLQESDTNRIAGGNCDVVRYFADALDMYSYYGPSPVTGTFGVALLSKYPLRNPKTFFMYSHGQGVLVKEQTAAIEAEVVVGRNTFHVFVTHLASFGPRIQQEQVLERTAGKGNVLLMGDFNFAPPSQPYRLTVETLEDSWAAYGHGRVEGREVPHRRRIDHIFVSPGTKVTESRYLLGPQSDHPALFTEIEWTP